ncbi:hypothetical protein [Nitrosomonas oligotropha]|uniref:hypothetical protein n=1 Tax=Nitrosomonas oligotropha TaxID=42354 RepID=UPI0011B1FDDD|nr:hypothetical protein [Nitrosomonas oligotropha]
MEKAVTEYGCHALALSLLGNVLRLRHKGDVLKRDTLRDLVKADGNRESRHAFKVMQAYEEWFAGEPELALLYLLGLFDHPIGQDVLKVLWDKQIPNLTAGISEDDWLESIITLREEHHLLSQHVKTDGALDNQLDCHPLIREYFGRQLREKQPDAWRHAHTRLYEYYKALPIKEFPDTLEEMQPLFNAVAHGCAAELYQLVIEEVYWLKIKRKGDHYLTKKLSAFSDDLAAVAHFFVTPWSKVVENLDDIFRFGVLGWAGYNLHALARLHESLELAYLAYDLAFENQKWGGCAKSAITISEQLLALGNLEEAFIFSRRSIDLANQCNNPPIQKLFLQSSTHAQHARVLHLRGETSLALDFFNRAMQFQKRQSKKHPKLCSQPGFFYCDLLLAQGKVLRALRLAKYAFKISRRADGGVGMGMSMLDIALDQLTHGRCFLLQNNFADTALWLDEAIQSFYKSMRQDDLPLGLLARAALYRDTRNPNHDFTRARQDLQEVYDIAEPSGMRLHLTDYHLEMARLLIAERENSPRFPLEKGEPEGISLHEHIAKAAKLIEETGYKRRLPELQELQHKLSAIIANDPGAIT